MKYFSLWLLFSFFLIQSIVSQDISDESFWKPIETIAKDEYIRVLVMDAYSSNESVVDIEKQFIKKFKNNRHLIILDRKSVNIALKEIESQLSGLYNESTQVELGKFLGATHLCIRYKEEIRFTSILTMETISVFKIPNLSERIPSSNTIAKEILPEMSFNIDINIKWGQRPCTFWLDNGNIFTGYQNGSEELFNPSIGFGFTFWEHYTIVPFLGFLSEQKINDGNVTIGTPLYSVCYGSRMNVQIKQFGLIGEISIFTGELLKGTSYSFGLSYYRIYGTITMLSPNGIMGGLGYIFDL